MIHIFGMLCLFVGVILVLIGSLRSILLKETSNPFNSQQNIGYIVIGILISFISVYTYYILK